MIRTIVLLALILGAFGGGVYSGIQLQKHWMRTDPAQFTELLNDPEFRKTMAESAKDKAGRIWDIIVEDL